MPLTGGETDKFGNWYEGLWTVFSMCEVLRNRADSICMEVLGKEGEGVEFRLNRGSTREYHQVKRQTARQEAWTIPLLEPVLSKFKNKLSDLNVRCFFVSQDSSTSFRELAEDSENTDSWYDFKTHYLSKGSRADHFKQLRRIWKCTGEQAYELLKRCDVRTTSEKTLRDMVDTTLEYVVQGKPGEVRRFLAEIAQKRLHHEFHGTELWNLLAKEGFPPRDWSKDPNILTRVRNVTERYANKVAGSLIGGKEIRREEAVSALEKLFDDSARQGLVITGSAGVGKSAVLLQLVRELQQRNIPVLAFRLDSLEPTNSPIRIGEQLQLPDSPVQILRGASKGQQCVLIIDQLDAVSLVSGRNPDYFDCIDEIIRQVKLDSQIHLILGCRKFDLINDHRLKALIGDHGIAEEIAVQPFDGETVIQILGKHGFLCKEITEQQLKVLSIPLHLWLLLETDPNRDCKRLDFSDEHALLDNFWTYKERQVSSRLGGASRWNEVIASLCNYMSDRQVLSAPRETLDNFRQTADIMASENVLAFDGKRWSFFHEIFFDYAFARTFVAENNHLVKWLTEDGQDLFRRSQVRQVLQYKREPAHMQSYLGDLQELLADPDVRFHIKTVVCATLADVSNPVLEEWRIIAPFVEDASPVSDRMRDDPMCRRVWRLLHGSVAWFRLLDSLSVVVDWLNDVDPGRVDQTIWLIASVQEWEADRVAELVEPFIGHSADWDNRLRYLVQASEPGSGRRFFELCLKLLEKGLLDNIGATGVVNRDFWSFFHTLPKRQPKWACELAIAYFERSLQLATSAGLANPFKEHIPESHFAKEFLIDTARKEPALFAQGMMKFMLAVISGTALPPGNVPRFDRVWGHRWWGKSFGVADELLEAMEIALTQLVKKSHDLLRQIFQPLLPLDYDTIQFLIIRAYTAKGPVFADEAIDYLLQNNARFQTGYAEDLRWASKLLLDEVTPYCSLDRLQRLENALLASVVFSKDPKKAAYSQFVLLDAVVWSRRSKRMWARWFQLAEQLDLNRPEAPRVSRAEAVHSPVPEQEIETWTDEQWLTAISAFHGDNDYERRSDGKLAGGAYELSSVLQGRVEVEPQRFGRLVQRFPDNTNPHYFNAVLLGLAKIEIDVETVEAVCKRCSVVDDRTTRMWICHLAADKAHLRLSADIMDMIIDYAMNDPDPMTTEYRKSDASEAPLESILGKGMNTVRGGAAMAIGRMLGYDHSHSQTFVPVLERLVLDPILEVRACVALPILMLSRFNHPKALELFQTLVRSKSSEFPWARIRSYVFNVFYAFAMEFRYRLARRFNKRERLGFLRRLLGKENSLLGDDHLIEFSSIILRSHFQSVLQMIQQLRRSRSDKSELQGAAEGMALAASQYAASFLYETAIPHFGGIKNLVWQMMWSQYGDVRQVGAQAACRSALNNVEARMMVLACYRGEIELRLGVAEVLARTVLFQAPFSFCSEGLRLLFHDLFESVRRKAARCFYKFSGEDFQKYQSLIDSFVSSPAFETDPDALISALDHSTMQLPGLLCNVAEAFIVRFGLAAGDIRTAAALHAKILGKLIVRLYSQTQDAAVRKRCLDIIDEMLSAESYDMEEALSAAISGLPASEIQ